MHSLDTFQTLTAWLLSAQRRILVPTIFTDRPDYRGQETDIVTLHRPQSVCWFLICLQVEGCSCPMQKPGHFFRSVHDRRKVHILLRLIFSSTFAAWEGSYIHVMDTIVCTTQSHSFLAKQDYTVSLHQGRLSKMGSKLEPKCLHFLQLNFLDVCCLFTGNARVEVRGRKYITLNLVSYARLPRLSEF